jgi:squalene cyclase
MSTEQTKAAIERARGAIFSAQTESGSWNVACFAGAATTAQVVVALRFIGDLGELERRAAGRWLEDQWLGAGCGFEGYPGAGEGELSASAAVWAGLHACGYEGDHPVLADARAFVERGGGEAVLLERFRRGDLSALFLAMVGLFPAERLPVAPAAMHLPGIERVIEKRLNVIIPFTVRASDAVVKALRDPGPRRAAGPLVRQLSPSKLASAAVRLEARATIAAFDRFRNLDGSWLYGDTYHAALMLAALAALGVDAGDPRVTEGRRFLAARAIHGRTKDGAATLWFPIFETDVWTTAFFLRALLASGVPPGDPRVQRAVQWLCDCQCGGAWAFQRLNVTMPDCDDVAVVIAALAMALQRDRGAPLEPPLAERTRQAIQAGRDWLYRRQNDDGGWASFQVGLPGKGRGPIMTRPPEVPGDGMWSYLQLWGQAPVDIGDPATEDLTGRVLFGLGRSGSRAGERQVRGALEFLRALQDSNGGWWGRWTINYLASTAWVLRGLRAVEADLQANWVGQAVRFLLEHQNDDGGWGETARSYRDASSVARGPSTPGLTGLVLSALLEVGVAGEHRAVTGAARYLLERQEPGGGWPDGGELHALLPPDLFYRLPGTPDQLAVEALGTWRQQRPRAVGPGEARPWDAARLDRLRQQGDPVADQVVREIFARDDIGVVNRLFHLLRRGADPLPGDLPPAAREYFAAEAELPGWAEPLRLDLARALFERCGFGVATTLFCSSLPQCFAVPEGAKILAASAAFQSNARRRVLETAQFVFDVAARGGLAPHGHGVRAAQKVRLVHAAVRNLVRRRAWDEQREGLPINQQQLLGTMLAFSTVVTDGLQALGFEVRDDEAEAWFHLWQVVGVLLGLAPEALPATVAEGQRVMQMIRQRYWGASPEGTAQTQATLSVMQELLPGKSLETLPAALVRHLAGDHCADLLDVPRASWARRFIESGALVSGRAVPRSLGRSPLIVAVQRASFALMKTLGELNLEGREVGFHLPAELGEP